MSVSIIGSKNATRIKGISYAGTPADGEVWIYDSASGNMIPGTAGGSLTPNIAHVMPSIGDDATGVVGDITKPFATVDGTTGDLTDGALQACVAGDLIKVYEDITILTTVTAGIYKAGVNYQMVDGINITKSTAGNLFTAGTSTIPFIVTGRADYTLDTVGKYLLAWGSNSIVQDAHFEYHNISQTIGTTFAVYGTAAKNVRLDGNDLLNTGGSAIDSIVSAKFVWNFNTIQCNGNTALSFSGNGNGDAVFNGSSIISQAGYAINISYRGEFIFNVLNIVGLDHAVRTNGFPGGANVLINGNPAGLLISNPGETVNVNGITRGKLQVDNGTVTCGLCNTATIVNGGSLELLANANTGTGITNNGGDVIVNYMGVQGYMASMNLVGGTTVIRGVLNPFFTNSRITVNGGIAILEATINYVNTLNVNNGYPIFVQSGTLILNSSARINNYFNKETFTCILWNGGDIISNGGTLLTAAVGQTPIRANASGLNLRVYAGGLTTNRPELGGILAAKQQIVISTMVIAQVSSITINGTLHTNTVTTSLAAMALDFVGLINAGAQSGNVLAIQTTPTDEFITIEAIVFGTPFTHTDGAGINPSVVQSNGYAITELVGGTIIEDINVI